MTVTGGRATDSQRAETYLRLQVSVPVPVDSQEQR
jgi:hypothetical protein